MFKKFKYKIILRAMGFASHRTIKGVLNAIGFAHFFVMCTNIVR